MALVHAEMTFQLDRLDEYLEQVHHEKQCFELDPDEIAVVFDTNVFMHVRQIDQITWSEHFPRCSVRLVIPLVVVDELDKLTYSPNKLVGERAKSAVKLLRELRGDDADAEVAVVVTGRPSVRTQILLDPRSHERQANVDAEILDRSEHLSGITGRPVTIGSGDYGVQLRAANLGLLVWEPPESLSRTLAKKAVPE